MAYALAPQKNLSNLRFSQKNELKLQVNVVVCFEKSHADFFHSLEIQIFENSSVSLFSFSLYYISF